MQFVTNGMPYIPIRMEFYKRRQKRMSKRKMVFAILFFLGVLLVNDAVLIEAFHQENQLAVDPLNQQ